MPLRIPDSDSKQKFLELGEGSSFEPHCPKKEQMMTTYVEVAQALVSGGYLTDSDVEAAAAVLEDALIIEAAEDVQAEAAEDYSAQKDLIAEAEVWESEDAVQGDYVGAEIDEEIIADSEEQKLVDKAVMVEA